MPICQQLFYKNSKKAINKWVKKKHPNRRHGMGAMAGFPCQPTKCLYIMA
jgi:hypothetical protein